MKSNLELEEKAESRSEFWDGKIMRKIDEVPTHSKISASIGTALNINLNKRNKDCSVYSSNLKVFIPDFNRGSYPDCIEVLSESTKEYDSNAKFEGYRSIPTFKEYVLI